ncbi:MAG: hypothetical protein ACXVEH_10855 [Nocardioides sp.]
MSRIPARPALLAALLPVLLTGCGGGDSSTPAASSTSSTSSTASSSPTGSATATASDAATGDTRTVTADGLSFSVPAGWTSVDSKDVADSAGGSDEFTQMADAMGLTAEQFRATMRSVDLFVFTDQGATGGMLDNVNVLHSGGSMPSDGALRLQFLHLGAKILDVRHVTTDAGEARVVRYTLAVGANEINGEAVAIDSSGSVVSITVSAVSRETADSVGGLVLDSLAPAA